MLSAKDAIEIAGSFVGDELREPCRYVRLERERVFATDGYRLLVLPIAAHSEPVGAYRADGSFDPHAVKAPPVDQIIPVKDAPVAVELSAPFVDASFGTERQILGRRDRRGMRGPHQ